MLCPPHWITVGSIACIGCVFTDGLEKSLGERRGSDPIITVSISKSSATTTPTEDIMEAATPSSKFSVSPALYLEVFWSSLGRSRGWVGFVLDLHARELSSGILTCILYNSIVVEHLFYKWKVGEMIFWSDQTQDIQMDFSVAPPFLYTVIGWGVMFCVFGMAFQCGSTMWNDLKCLKRC